MWALNDVMSGVAALDVGRAGTTHGHEHRFVRLVLIEVEAAVTERDEAPALELGRARDEEVGALQARQVTDYRVRKFLEAGEGAPVHDCRLARAVRLEVV